MVYLGLIALTTLIANGATRLRLIAIAFVGVAAIASLIASASASGPQVAVTASAGLAAAGILYVAARDRTYGEDPGWRLWLGTFTAAIVRRSPTRRSGRSPVRLPRFPCSRTDPGSSRRSPACGFCRAAWP